MSGQGDVDQYHPRQLTGMRKIFSALSLIAIILFIILFATGLAIFYASPILVSKTALATAPVNTGIVVEFSKDMNKTSVEDAFWLVPATNTKAYVSGNFTWPTDNVMVFLPTESLRPGTWYYTGINNTAKDLKNNELSSDPWEFKTSSSIGKSTPSIPTAEPDTLTVKLPPEIKTRSPLTLRGDMFVVTPWVITFGYLEGYSLIAWYFLVVLAITISIVYLLKTEGKVTGRVISFSLKKFQAPPEDSNNSLVIIIQLFLAQFAFEMAYMIILLYTGGSIESPDYNMPVGKILYDLANASVYEELIVRLLIMGIPLALVYLVSRRNVWNGLLGGGKRFGAIEVFLILVSAAIFGLAHWLSGWGAWKIVPAFVAGIVFGYLFVKIGLHAAILFHFVNNYLSVPFLLISDITVQAMFVIIEMFLLFVGVSYFIYYIKAMVLFVGEKAGLVRADKDESEPAAASAIHDVAQGTHEVTSFPTPSEFGYTCLSCGWMEAKYLGVGKFKCLRCGAVSGQTDGGGTIDIDKIPSPDKAPSVIITVSVGTEPPKKQNE